MNMNKQRFEKLTSNILSVLGNPFRIKIAFALSEQEACVCHLESLLKKRQAYISQHLMALRKAGLLETRRDGKFVYYRLSDPAVIDLIRGAALIAGLEIDTLPEVVEKGMLEQCVCPHCGEKDIDLGNGKSSLVSASNI
jgi:ArsR family transcriptional regulator